MKCIDKIVFLTAVCIVLSYSAVAQTSKTKDLSPSWYKRFAGKIGTETGIIHIQKSYKNAVIAIHTPTYQLSFEDTELTFSSDKIEAEKKDNEKKESKVFRGIIKEDKLTGNLVLPSNTVLVLDLQENYTDAAKVKLYEYSYADKGNFETVLGSVKYYYHYGLLAIPEYNIANFEKKITGTDIGKRFYEGLKGEIKNLEKGQFLTSESSEQVYYNQNDILIVANRYYTYEGGAHGMYGCTYLHHDLQKNKEITLEDVFIKDYQKILTPLLLKKSKELNIPLLSDTIEPTENFLLSSKTITFVYQPYEIASYADGIIEIEIPYQEIKEILKPNSFLDRVRK
jgi:hypothetical protein